MTQTTFTFPESEQRRLNRQQARILELLQQGPQLNTDLTAVCLRYGARLKELRDAGHNIRTTPVRAGVFKYELCTTPTHNN